MAAISSFARRLQVAFVPLEVRSPCLGSSPRPVLTHLSDCERSEIRNRPTGPCNRV